jgi:Protein of unknown function (DUF2911)
LPRKNQFQHHQISKNNMKKVFALLTIAAFTFVGLSCSAQGDKSKRPSPPAEAKISLDGTAISINYSKPSVKGRKVWGGIVPYGEVWRTGANEATVFETDKAVTIEGKDLPAGKYALFTIPGEKEWVIIFNKTFDQWGAYDYNAAKDALRVTVAPASKDAATEQMTFDIDKDGKVTLSWEKLAVAFQVKAK